MVKRGRPEGYVMSESSKLKISRKLKGRTLSEEHKRHIAIAMVGNKNSLGKPRKRRSGCDSNA